MSRNTRLITTFQFVCPVTSNGVVSTTTLPVGAAALPRAVRTTRTVSAITTAIPANIGVGASSTQGSLTTSLPQENTLSGIPMTTTMLTTLPNGEVSTIVTATMLPPLTTATRTVGIIPFTTTLTIDVFPTPRPIDLDAYLPNYAAVADGSLVTPLYLQSSMQEHMRIFVAGALLMLFIRNILASIDYLRRTSSRDRTLFWLLIFSQMWGPVRFIPIAAGFFSRASSCRAIQIISYAALEISYSVLVTFILGMKAYRCLKRSKIVLGVIGSLQITAYVVFLIGLPRTTVSRELSGDCISTSNSLFIALAVLLQFIESGFIFCCFLYAVIKSSRRSATQGRMSIALSSAPSVAPDAPTVVVQPSGEPPLTPGLNERRGWWDYVPDDHAGVGIPEPGEPGYRLSTHTTGQAPTDEAHLHPVERWRGRVSTLWKRSDGPTVNSQPVSPSAATAPRKSSIHTDEPLPHPNRGEFGTLSEKKREAVEAAADQTPELALVDSRTGLATGVESARTGSGARSRGKSSGATKGSTEKRRPNGMMRMPKIVLLRSVMKDELFYTAMIALSCVISTIGLVLGAGTNKVVFGGSVWLEINWAVVSVLVMRSYAQVIARQERDAVLQDPSAWNVAIRSEDGFGRSPALRRGAMDYGFARAQRTPPSFISRRSDISSNAFHSSPRRGLNTLSVSTYGSAIERARRADDSREPAQSLPETDLDDPFSDFERIVDMPRQREREPGSPVPSSRHDAQAWHEEDEPGPSNSVSQAPGPGRTLRGPPPTVPRRGATDYSTGMGTMSILETVPARSINRGPPSPQESRDSSAYEPSFIEDSPDSPTEPRVTHS